MKTAIERSFKARIRNLAENHQLDPAVIWQNLVLERFLVRLAQSQHANHFILKGGILLSKILKIERETRDLDFSIQEKKESKMSLKQIIEEIAQKDINDGL